MKYVLNASAYVIKLNFDLFFFLFFVSCDGHDSSCVLMKIFAIYFNKILNDSPYCQIWDLKSTCEMLGFRLFSMSRTACGMRHVAVRGMQRVAVCLW